jgi:hypothetical protein
MDKRLTSIERWSAILALCAVLASLWFRRLDVFLGVAIGAAVAVANFRLLRGLLTGVIRSSGRRQQLLGMLLLAKMGALLAVIYLVLRFLPVHVVSFVCGISVVMVSIFMVSLGAGLRQAPGAGSAPSE